MKKIILLLSFAAIIFTVNAQEQDVKTSSVNNYPKPKLVIGIIIDQMRWDYLYRFYDLYKPTGGFKRLMSNGFSCDNTFVPYLPTVTACGHTCVYTGSVPAIHGITDNEWFDNNIQKNVYCVSDKSVQTVGSNSIEEGQMSPNNMFVTTVTDELRLATNFKNKVIGISIKDRGAILPAGHAANAAYWFDSKSGNFITSTYYMNELPKWLQQFNDRKLADSLLGLNWDIALPKDVYERLCDTDTNYYESKPFGDNALHFPYNLSGIKENNPGVVAGTPYGNTLLAELAKTIIANERLGNNDITDFLAVSFSSTDYVGHAFGPNSWELLDTYVRLDETLGNFLDYLDDKIGKDNYTVFLTADHGASSIPEFLNEKHKIPSVRKSDNELKTELNALFEKEFSIGDIVSAVKDYNIYINHAELQYAKQFPTVKIDEDIAKKRIMDYLLKDSLVLNVVDIKNISNAAIPQHLKEVIANSYNPQRSGDLEVIMKAGVMDVGGKTGMSHGVWNTYDSHIPLLFYGWGIKHGSLAKNVYMTDIAPTIAALLHIQTPSGNIGNVITEVMK